MADSKIGILIAAKDEASAGIKNVSTNLKEINSAANTAAGGIGALGAALGVASAIGLGKLAFDLAETAAGAQEARDSFNTLAKAAGQSGDQVFNAMKAAAGGLVSNAELVQSANQAMLLGVASSGDQMAKLLEVARVRSDAMGQSVAETFNQLVEGIGRMTTRTLTQAAGIQDADQALADYAATVGKTVEQLSDAEKRQVLFNAVIDQNAGLVNASAGSAESAADKFDRMAASITNAKDAIGELILATGLPDLLDVLAAGFEKDAEDAKKLADAAHNLKAAFDEMATTDAQNVLSNIGPQITAAAAAFNTALTDFQNAAIASGAAAGNLEPLSQKIQELGGELQDLAAQYNKAAAITGAPLIDVNQLQAGIVAFQDTSSAAKAAAAGLDKVAAAGPRAAAGIDDASTAALGGFKHLRALAIAARDLAIQFTNASTDVGAAALQQDLAIQNVDNALEAHQQALRDAESESKRFASELESNTKKAAAEAERAFDSLKGKVEGVLSGARTDIGINVDDLLPREDAVNENARRLADIAVNGFKGQDWMAEFKAEVPEAFKQVSESADPKGTAARMLKEFQDGLQPELIDKEKAKDLVRKMIFGDQQADQLATEIATELAAEFGTAAPANLNELVGQALGTGTKGAGATGGATAGADAATSFTQAFTSAASGVGAQIAASLKVDSVIALIKDAGKAAGETWSDIFLSVVGDHVPDSLVQLLTDLVTPGVQARLATQTSLTAAKVMAAITDDIQFATLAATYNLPLPNEYEYSYWLPSVVGVNAAGVPFLQLLNAVALREWRLTWVNMTATQLDNVQSVWEGLSSQVVRYVDPFAQIYAVVRHPEQDALESDMFKTAGQYHWRVTLRLIKTNAAYEV